MIGRAALDLLPMLLSPIAAAAIPLGRLEQPADGTGAAIFLASTDSDDVTQQTRDVDGGNWPG